MPSTSSFQTKFCCQLFEPSNVETTWEMFSQWSGFSTNWATMHFHAGGKRQHV
jgi:hypothetical protein